MNNNKQMVPEIKHYKSNLIKSGTIVILLLISLIIVLVVKKEFDFSDIITQGVIYLIIFVSPVAIYNAFKLKYYLSLKPTFIQESLLDNLESRWSTHMCFIVKMNFSGRIEEVETLRIFKPRPVGFNRVDDFLNKKVLVGYDEEKKKCIVLEILD